MSIPNFRVAVFHPGLQHSHQLAWALHEGGLLAKFVSGIPVHATGELPSKWLPGGLARRVKLAEIPPHLRSNPVIFQVPVKLARFLAPEHRDDVIYRAFHLFDLWSSGVVRRMQPDVVVGFEDSACEMFEAAKGAGAQCILDLPSIEHSAGDKLLGARRGLYARVVNERKKREIQLADRIICCSDFAASTYVESGVPVSKVEVLKLGATPPYFSESRNENAELRIVFAGTFSYRKSCDLLLQACDRLSALGHKFKLDIVGAVQDSEWIDRLLNTQYACVHGQVPQARLFEILRAADCLLLPSRFDSFGMVVIEALSCGTPVVVSNTTGAKEILLRNPEAGWVIEPNAESICRMLARFLEDPRILANARGPALLAATEFTWEAYRKRVLTFFQSIQPKPKAKLQR